MSRYWAHSLDVPYQTIAADTQPMDNRSFESTVRMRHVLICIKYHTQKGHDKTTLQHL